MKKKTVSWEGMTEETNSRSDGQKKFLKPLVDSVDLLTWPALKDKQEALVQRESGWNIISKRISIWKGLSRVTEEGQGACEGEVGRPRRI